MFTFFTANYIDYYNLYCALIINLVSSYNEKFNL